MNVRAFSPMIIVAVLLSLFFSMVPALSEDSVAIAAADQELYVSATSENGTTFVASAGGIYRFTITGGAVETCPQVSQPDHPDWWGWKTEILIYKNRPVYWSGGYFAPEHPNPAIWDFSVGRKYFLSTCEAAEAAGKGLFVDIALTENEYVILVANDCKGCFGDNSGGVYFSITILPPVPQYNLTISSTTGGSVTTPGEGNFTYEEGTVVGLEAGPDDGCQFVEWTGDVGTITNVEAVSTTIMMNDNYSITANFEAAGGCFIATAACGTPMAEEIQILREFRDEYLLTNSLGQGLVAIYYRISPPIADFISEHPSLKLIVRAGLMPVVSMCSIVCDIVLQFTGNDA